jgi:hypothetical protein
MESATGNHLFPRHSNWKLSYILKDSSFEPIPFLRLNEELDNIRLLHEINEASIERFLKMLEDSDASDQHCYWLVMARIFELALFCAGNYADNCEFSAAGDLLVNPRKILIHRKGCPNSLVKQRHSRLSEQLNKDRIHRHNFMRLLKHEVSVEITKPAILPYLFERLQHGQRIAAWYLHNAEERMKKIADTIGFLSAWSVLRFEDLHRRMQAASPKTRRFIDTHLCRFDTRYFQRLGREIKNFIENANVNCAFLVH